MPKPETRLVHSIIDRLREVYPSAYLRKIHGSIFQHAGIPDIIGCIEGYFIGLEVKTTDGHVSKIQELEGLSILQASGIYGVVTSPEEALGLIKHRLICLQGQ
jgi:hypothetical protein